MYLHANAKLGLAGRFALVRAIEGGLSLKAAAAAFSVSPATVHRWWHRWLEAGEEGSAHAVLSARSPLRLLPAARPPGDRRPLTALTQLDASGDEGWP